MSKAAAAAAAADLAGARASAGFGERAVASTAEVVGSRIIDVPYNSNNTTGD